MEKASILIVEDDSFISEDLADQLRELGYLVSGQAYTYDEALEHLSKQTPDLVLLDIHLENSRSGIELAKIINARYQLPFIFVTSYSDSKTLKELNETEPSGYLLKPFEEQALQANIELAFFKFRKKEKRQVQNPLSDSFFVKVKNSLIKLQVQDICYAEAYDNYCYIKTLSQKYLVSQTLKSVEEKLQGLGFMRVHRGFLINIHHIQSVSEGTVYVGKDPVPIGRSFRDELLSLLNTL